MGTGTKFNLPHRQTRWFEPSSIGGMSPLGKIISYFFLLFWSLVVLFPIYWLCITAFKSMDDVNFGPVYIPWVDFTPSLHAWRNIIVDDMADVASAYFNSIVIAFFSTIFCGKYPFFFFQIRVLAVLKYLPLSLIRERTLSFFWST